MAYPQPATDPTWWRKAVIYQVYLRSFADGNCDGTGDLAGLRRHLPYLRDLGVDAMWITPWYVSPMADGGYDVADYREIDPVFGSLADAEAVIAEALELGIRTIIDIVPNHVSNQHEWFRQALAAPPGSAERRRFWFRDGRGPGGDEMPTRWKSDFQGTTWTRTVNSDGSAGQWYLHLFTPEQPDLNWSNPEVHAEFDAVLRFWLDRGVAGIRIDSAALLVKDPALPDYTGYEQPGEHPHVDRDELHDIYRSWRAITDSYPGTRILVGEVWLADRRRFARYLRHNEMHTAFNFDFMARPWDAKELRESIEMTLSAHAPVGAPATWVLSNHDVTRPVTRYGREDSSFAFASKRFGVPTDLDTGLRRARAAALLAGALPGAWYIYQGDELGLPEVEDLPEGTRQDPMHFRSGGTDPGRDGCRVPLPWAGQTRPYAFSGAGVDVPAWLPQPVDWVGLTVQTQSSDPSSMLHLYRDVLARRRAESALGDSALNWLEVPEQVIAFRRGDIACVVNFGPEPVALPDHLHVLLASGELVSGRLPTDTAVWLRLPRDTPALPDHGGDLPAASVDQHVHDRPAPPTP